MEMAELLMASPDIDLIIGHHAHVDPVPSPGSATRLSPSAWETFCRTNRGSATQDGVMIMVPSGIRPWMAGQTGDIGGSSDLGRPAPMGHVIRSALSSHLDSLVLRPTGPPRAIGLLGAVWCPCSSVLDQKPAPLGPGKSP